MRHQFPVQAEPARGFMPSLRICSKAHLSARSNTPAATRLTPDSEARLAADCAISEAAWPAISVAAIWPV
ncbi:MAG TPA: hypothetical protein DCX52_14450, partial [Massilia sp.]|nr:hypothetical protein [Massilia sp.]